QILLLVHIADEVELVQTGLGRFWREGSIVFDDALHAPVYITTAKDHTGVAELMLEAHHVLVQILAPRSGAKRFTSIQRSTRIEREPNEAAIRPRSGGS